MFPPFTSLIVILDVNIEAPPSLLPSRKYCDITGFVAPYRDPQTNLRYSSVGVYHCIHLYF